MSVSPPARAFVDEHACGDAAGELFGKIRSTGREPVNLHRVLAVAPDVGGAMVDLALVLRQSTLVSPEYRELMILRTAQLEGGHYEFAAHSKIALSSGLTSAQIAALETWTGGDLFTERHCAILGYADALAARARVPDAVYFNLARYFSPNEIVELTIAAGFYACVSRISCGLAVALDV